jgi:hypothetical protein
MTDRPNPYAEFRALAVTLESNGVDLHSIIAGAFRVAMDGMFRTVGRRGTAEALLQQAVLTADPTASPIKTGGRGGGHQPRPTRQ